MSLPQFKLLRPRTVDEAVGHLGKHAANVRILAGGTDLIPSMQQKLFEPEYVLDLRSVPGLRGIRLQANAGAEIGALTPLSEIERSTFLQAHYSVLSQAAATVASPVLRHMGTVGGNICLDTRCLWYNQSLPWRKGCGFCIKKDGDLCHVAPGGAKCWAVFSGDTPAALLCLGAEVEIVGPEGVRRMPLAEFYTGIGDNYRNLRPNELLTRVFLPTSSADYHGVYRKLRVRVKGACEILAGKMVDDSLAEVVGDLAARTAKPLTTSALTPEYRREMIRVFTKRAVLASASN